MDYNYVYGLGQRLAKYKGTEQYLYHNDHLGSLRAVTSQLGSVIGSQDYYPYGERLALTGSPGKYAYNQKEYVDDWGFDLYYYGARFMDPVTGRFITPDPVKDYLNPYSYVSNNPVNRIDPLGLSDGGFGELTSQTGYEFMGQNDFWWANVGTYLAWKFSMFGSHFKEDLEQEQKEKEAEENRKEEERRQKEAFRKLMEQDPNVLKQLASTMATLATDPIEKAGWLLLAKADPDFLYVSGGGSAWVSGQIGGIIDKWGQKFIYASVGVLSSPGPTGEIMIGYFITANGEATAEQSQKFLSGFAGGMSAQFGISYDVCHTGSGNIIGYQAFGIGGLWNIGPFISYSLSF